MRDKYSGTYLIDGDKIEKLNTKTDQTISPLVYPSWHPSGKYVAFSVNQTSQSFHANDKNRVEVFDSQSDVVVYDTEKHEIISTPSIRTAKAFETFPTFSPDGKTLYFCSIPYTMPEKMGRAPLFPVFPQTGNSCYIRCPATVTSRSGIKTQIYIYWI